MLRIVCAGDDHLSRLTAQGLHSIYVCPPLFKLKSLWQLSAVAEAGIGRKGLYGQDRFL